jgi:hypothetical protein
LALPGSPEGRSRSARSAADNRAMTSLV